jgi:type I restriction enzyme S subunit
VNTVGLDRLIAPAGSRAGADSNYPVFSVTKHSGFVRSDAYFKKQVHSRDLGGYKRVRAGDFAYSTIHLDEGAVGVAPCDGLISPMYTVFAADFARVVPEYLIRFLKSPVALVQYARLGKGSVHRRRSISLEALGTLQVPLPPLEEQRRIAAILDSADALRVKRREVLAHLSTLTQSILAGVLSSEGSSAKVRVGDVCTRVTDGTHQSPPWTTEGIPFLFVSNITSGEIDFNTTRFISSETWRELTRNSPIECGDVLYSSVGSYGNPVVVRTSSPFAFQRHIAHLKPKRNVLQSDFLAAQLDSRLVRNQARNAAKGIAQPTVNLSDIRQFEIQVPSLKVQNKFAELSAVIRAERGRMLLAQATETALFASMQARAFRGEL